MTATNHTDTAKDGAGVTITGGWADVSESSSGAKASATYLKNTDETLVAAPMQMTGGTIGVVAGTAVVGKVGIDQTTPGTTNLVAAGQNGTWNITNVSGTVSLPTGAATSALQTTINTTLGTPMQQTGGTVSGAANTSGGVSTYAALGGTGNALLTNSAVAVKASAGNLYGVEFVNAGASGAYVQVFDVASGSVTLGTTVPKLVYWVPSGGAWDSKFSTENKVSFATAITMAATTTVTGSSAPATGIQANIYYK